MEKLAAVPDADVSDSSAAGGSYGGYAALVGITFTPEVFACAVDSCGPSNLITFLETIPPYWMGGYRELTTWLGADKNTSQGRAFLRSRSPLFFANRVTKPLIILQGANDPRVKENESRLAKKHLLVLFLNIPPGYDVLKRSVGTDQSSRKGRSSSPKLFEILFSVMILRSGQFVNELVKLKIPVTYVLYPDEGHGFGRPQNSLAEAGFVERFLHRCLHGRYEKFSLGQGCDWRKVGIKGTRQRVISSVPPPPNESSNS
uniref:Peptidase S9 prolyl oligopeptidase catalytic domain-containing protein n=1 Tax=Parascaris equorum TaxID=6256 RepID=A0A914RTK6_PAREQ